MSLLKRRERSGGPLTTFESELGDLFGRFFEDWPLAVRTGTMWPAIDVAEQEDKVVVKADLPGVTSEDLDISVLDNTLTISGEKKESKEQHNGDYYHMERRYGSFRRDVRLPATVDPERVEARFHDGVLTVTMAKDQKAMPKRIEIK